MGLLDSIFKTNKNRERQERERAQAAERAAAEERVRQERMQREKEEAEERRRREQERLAREAEQASSSMKKDVDDIISTFESGDIPYLQHKLYNLCNKLNKHGAGELIISFPEKDRLCEVFSLCLNYDWMNDGKTREVWAENGFYCIAEYFKEARTKQDYLAAALDMFLLCAYGRTSLYTTFDDILKKTCSHPIHFTVFTNEDYNGGASYLVREFMFFAATVISPVVKAHPQIISPAMKNEFATAKSDFEFASVSPEDIMKKMYHISSIIGSILERY